MPVHLPRQRFKTSIRQKIQNQPAFAYWFVRVHPKKGIFLCQIALRMNQIQLMVGFKAWKDRGSLKQQTPNKKNKVARSHISNW